jgi:hypothetical protein
MSPDLHHTHAVSFASDPQHTAGDPGNIRFHPLIGLDIEDICMVLPVSEALLLLFEMSMV